MSTIYDVIVTSPFSVDRDSPVAAGLEQLGFAAAPDHDRPADRRGDHRHVWLRLCTKIGHDRTLDDLLADVAALPWPRRWGAATVLAVLWTDDHATEDDHWGGRVSPYGWSAARIVIPAEHRSGDAPTVEVGYGALTAAATA